MTSRILPVSILMLIGVSAQELPLDEDLRAASEEIARGLLRDGQASRETISGYSVMRRYVLRNTRWNQHAEMTVGMVFSYPNQKRFDLVSLSGPEWMLSVLKSLLESERKATLDGRLAKFRITPENYDMRIIGADASTTAETYVLDVSPKAQGSPMLRGRAWVERKDAAIVRFEGRPLERISFWVGRPFIVQTFSKVGPVWLPASTRSVVDSRLFGRTELSVESFDYVLMRRAPGQPVAPPER